MTDIDAIGILIVIVLIVLLGDAYSKEWCAGFYRTAGGLEYRQSPLPRSGFISRAKFISCAA